MTQTRETYHFIHNVFGHFFKDMLDYFSTTLYPRFEYRVVGTYDKAVEYLAKRSQYDRETDQPLLPALVLNPSGEFSPADANAGGKQLWRFPNLAPSMIKRIFNPVYQDDHLIMHAAFIRIKGEFELIMLLNSFYEYCDLRLLLINYFGGLDRIIYPRFFSSFIILPDSFLTYEYQNEYTGTNYNIDWTTADASNQLVRSTARNEVVLPVNIKPQISLVSMADASNRYGGPDKIAEWRLTATINYEIEMPNYMVLESDYLAENVHLEMRYGSAFSLYNDYQPPVNRQIYNYHWDWGLDETSNSRVTYLNADDATCETGFVGDYVYKTRYFHEVTSADAAEDPYLDIDLPETITDKLVLIVNSKHGALNFGDHYIIVDKGDTLRIKMDNVNLKAGWFLELFYYEDITSSSSSSSSLSSSSSSLSSSSSSSSSSLSSSSSSVSSSSTSSSSSVSVAPYVWQDTLQNDTYWVESDPPDVLSFTGGGLVKAGSGFPTGSSVGSDTKWSMSDEWDCYFNVDLTSDTGLTTSNSPYLTIMVTESPNDKGANNAFVGIQGDGAGNIEYSVGDTSAVTSPDDTFGSFSAPQSNMRFRIRRNADDSLTFWVWVSGQWEWDGNTDGWTIGAIFNYEKATVKVISNDGSGIYFEWTMSEFTQTAGTWNDES
jgi:hypothetical protein